MKKLSLLLAVTLLAACGEPDAPQQAQTPPPAQPAPEQASKVEPIGDTIVVGTDAAYPPYNYRDEKGQSTGFDMDILNAIGAKQNLKFTFIPDTAEKVLPNLDAKKYKVAISGFVRSAEREQKYQVSNTYAWGQDVFATLSTTPNPPETMADVKSQNRKVLVLGGSFYVEQMEGILGKNAPNLLTANSAYHVLRGLVTGEADVAFIDKGVVQHYAKSFPDVKINLGGKGSADFDKYEMVILADKEEVELMQKINAGLAEIVKDGTYAQIYKNWFGEEPKDLPAVK